MPRRGAVLAAACAVIALGLLADVVPTGAQSRYAPTLTHESAVVHLNAQGRGSFSISLDTAGASATRDADLSLFPAVRTVDDLSAVTSGAGETGLPVSSTGRIRIDCAGLATTTFTVTTGAGPGAGTGPPTCGGDQPYLDLDCHDAACGGVYPLEIVTTNGTATATTWSLLTVVTSQLGTPVNVALFFLSDPQSTRTARQERAALSVLAAKPTDTFAVGVDYAGMSRAVTSTDPAYASFRTAFAAAMDSVHHTLVNAPPPSVEFGGLAAHGLAADVSEQVHFGTELSLNASPRLASQWVVLSGDASLDDLDALAAAHVHDVVLPDSDVTPNPTSTLAWGTPFTIDGAPSSLLAVSSDGSLANLAQDGQLAPGLRAALVVGDLSFLHYEAPFAPTARTEVLVSSLHSDGAAFVRDLLDGISQDPLLDERTLAGLFSRAAVGADGHASSWAPRLTSPDRFSRSDAVAVRDLDRALRSLNQSILSLAPVATLQAATLQTETRADAANRAKDVTAVQDRLNRILSQFKIDETTINLTGGVTALPITITSTSPYPLTGYLSLSAPGVTFPGPNGNLRAVTIANTTAELRVPAQIHGSGNFTLVVRLLSADRHLLIATGAIPVRSASTSVVGYLLSALALVIIALWWMRTTKRRPRGQHAR